MVNAHLLAVTSAGASTVNVSAADCKNCQSPSGTSEAPSFATLLEEQTNEGAPLSDQPQFDHDPATSQSAMIVPAPEQQPTAGLLALAANPVSPEGERTDLAHSGALIGQIAPLTVSDPSDQKSPANAAPMSDQGTPATILPQAPIVAPAAAPLAQDNQQATAASHTAAPEANNNLSNPQIPVAVSANGDQLMSTTPSGSSQTDLANSANGAALAANEEIFGATAPVPSNGPALPETQILSPRDVPQVVNDNARPPVSQPLPEQLVAKAHLTSDDALLAQKTLEANPKAVNSTTGNGAAKANPEEAQAPLNASPTKTPASEIAAPNGSEPTKQPVATSGPTIDAPTPVKINRDAPLRDAPQPQNTSTAPEQPASPIGDAKPASLMERLKPLAHAAFSFQTMDSAPSNAKALDALTPAFSMSTTGEMARPAGISGLTPTATTPNLPQVPLNNIAVHIASQASAGHQRFNIRLDPPELGRIDIRLEIGRDGQTLTHLAVEKPETLDLLRQDQRALERALNNAGLDSRNGSLSFSLRDENQNRQQAGAQQGDGTATPDDKLDEQEGDEPVITQTLNMSSGLDISI